MVPVVISFACCVDWLRADTFAELVIPEAFLLAISSWEASARAGLFVPVETGSANSWAASANALFIIENFAVSTNLWSANTFFHRSVEVFHVRARLRLREARAGLDVPEGVNWVFVDVEQAGIRAVLWAAKALA